MFEFKIDILYTYFNHKNDSNTHKALFGTNVFDLARYT